MGLPIIHASPRIDAELLPARMCNELVYCPRLFHLEHVQGIFVQNAATIEGSAQHDRAERRGRRRTTTPATADDDPRPWSLPRQLSLHSEQLGVTGKIDFVEENEDAAVVVEAKRGRAPKHADHRWHDHELPYGAWPTDVVQVGIYMAILREHGVPCDAAKVYYRASKTTVEIPWSAAIDFFVRDVLRAAREVAATDKPPPPLVDSPKCVGCSLHEVCLPDEHNLLLHTAEQTKRPRRIIAGRDDRGVVYVMSPGTVVRKQGESLLVCPRHEEPQRLSLGDVGHVALFGPSSITQPCLTHLMRAGVPISHHTSAGRLVATTQPLATVNIGIRRAQYRSADDEARRLEAARAFVLAKIRNQRTVLRRHRNKPSRGERQPSDEAQLADSLTKMKIAHDAARRSTDIDALRGHEGDAAARYFAALPSLLPEAWRADFDGRSRRPPRDRVNAMLGFGYALLVRDTTAALARVGLDPMLGLYHTMIPGRPALALDLMEPFRAAWVDTAILRLIATGGVQREGFHFTTTGVSMSDATRRRLIGAYERRGDEMMTHPQFGYRLSYRRLVELEARILGKWLLGEVDELRPVWTR